MIENYLPTLKQFFSNKFKQTNSHIKHKNFSTLYLRKSNYYIKDTRYENVIQIASIQAKKQNKGSFSTLIKEIKELEPDKIIIVENVLEIGGIFSKKLKHLGFEEFNIEPEFFSSFVLWPQVLLQSDKQSQ